MAFNYRAINTQGNAISGQIAARDIREASRLLREQDLNPIEITLESGHIQKTFIKKTRDQEKVIVIREFATLLQAGVPLAEAVESIGESHTGTQIGKTFLDTLKLLRGGESLAQSLQKTDLSFPPYLFQLITAGEMTGKLAHSIQTAANQMEYEERIRQEMRNALTYPIILIISGISATLLVFIVVVPKFANLIKHANADLPWISKFVISTGLFVQQNLIWVFLAIAAIILFIIFSLGNQAIRQQLFEMLSRIPILGTWLIELEVGRWAAMLGALLENRVPIITAMELAQEGIRLNSLKNKLQQAIRQVRAGQKLAEALSGTHALGVTGLNLIRVGERSGELSPMLRALVTLYENAGRDRMKRFMLLLEPIAILIIGGIIGVIMIAIMLAITSMNNISL